MDGGNFAFNLNLYSLNNSPHTLHIPSLRAVVMQPIVPSKKKSMFFIFQSNFGHNSHQLLHSKAEINVTILCVLWCKFHLELVIQIKLKQNHTEKS
jgi:hypothetical protein